MMFVLKFLTHHDKSNEESSNATQDWLVTNVKILQLFATYANLDLNKSLNGKRTKLIHLAAVKQNNQIIEYLLPLISEKNPIDLNGNSPMLISIKAGTWSQIQLFLPYCQTDELFWTRSHGPKGPPIFDVIMAKNLKLLEEINVNLDTAYGDMSAYPLHIAVFSRDLKVLQYIHQKVENKNPMDGLGRSVLELAQHLKCLDIVDCLQKSL